MTTGVSQVAQRSPVTVATGFICAFIVGSLAVQLVRSHSTAVPAPAASVEPVIAGPAALWSALGERDTAATGSAAAVKPAAAVANPNPVIGSEATLWSTLGER